MMGAMGAVSRGRTASRLLASVQGKEEARVPSKRHWGAQDHRRPCGCREVAEFVTIWR